MEVLQGKFELEIFNYGVLIAPSAGRKAKALANNSKKKILLLKALGHSYFHQGYFSVYSGVCFMIILSTIED